MTRALLARLAYVELVQPVLARALEPFPTAVRTLEALHLASIDFLRAKGQQPALATFDLGPGTRLSSTFPAADIGVAQVDLATAGWVQWWNAQRLHPTTAVVASAPALSARVQMIRACCP